RSRAPSAFSSGAPDGVHAPARRHRVHSQPPLAPRALREREHLRQLLVGEERARSRRARRRLVQARARPESLMRGTRMDRLAELIAVIRRNEDSPQLDAVLEILLPRFSVERNRYSDIFEFSYCFDGAPRFLRFSYAFPKDPIDLRLFAPWGV